MSSIGPQLPPHLQKRKRTPGDDDDNAPEPPPSKTMRQANNDEIALDDSSSDDGYGPSTGPSVQQPPRHGPSLPSPSSAPTTTTRPSQPQGPAAAAPPPPKPSIGPTPPPAPLSTLPSTSPNPNSDSDSDSDDDDYGPSLPTSATHQTRLSALPPPPPATASAPPKRDDWMLAPPSAPTGYRERDPAKLKARKFATGRAAAGNDAHAGGVSAIWTETPEEKARRLRDAVLGRRGAEESAAGGGRRPPAAAAAGEAAPTARARTADEERIRAFTEQTRGRSLYDEHQMRKKEGEAREKEKGKGGKAEEDDDPSKRAFSWEKDMKARGTISHSQRRELLNKSADFGGRFQKGSYL